MRCRCQFQPGVKISRINVFLMFFWCKKPRFGVLSNFELKMVLVSTKWQISCIRSTVVFCFAMFPSFDKNMQKFRQIHLIIQTNAFQNCIGERAPLVLGRALHQGFVACRDFSNIFNWFWIFKPCTNTIKKLLDQLEVVLLANMLHISTNTTAKERWLWLCLNC